MADVPHFSVTTIAGERIDYATIWQQRHLVLIALPRSESPDAADYVARLHDTFAHAPADTAIVVTRDEIPGIPAPAAVVADRWGEIIHSVRTARVAGLPPPGELLEWIDHLRQRCPECEGEAR